MVDPENDVGANILERLSNRELEVLAMTARGLTNVEMGSNLHVSVHAVKFHLASIFRKLKVSNRTEAAVVFLENRNAQASNGAVGT